MEKLKEYELDDKVIGITPNLNKNKVGEIMKTISDNNYDNYIVLDDENLDIPFLIKTNRYNGLSLNNVEQGIKILNKNME